MSYDVYLERAERLSEDQRAEFDRARDARVRVVRSVVFEGRGDLVLRQIAMSLPIGTKEIGRAGDGSLTITVAQGEIEVLGKFEPSPPAPEEVRRALIAEANNALQVVEAYLEVRDQPVEDAREALRSVAYLLQKLRA